MEHGIFGAISELTRVVAYTGRDLVSNSTITDLAGQAQFLQRYGGLARRTRHTQTVIETKLVRRSEAFTVAVIVV
jgi:hypothetical protein